MSKEKDLKNMTDSELAELMIDLIKRVKLLYQQLTDYFEYGKTSKKTSKTIRESYKQLKSECQEYYHYVHLRRNWDGSELYEAVVSPALSEAFAKGFECDKNNKISLALLNAVSDAEFYLTYYKSLEEWEKILNSK